MKRELIAYAAGLFDGEGYVRIMGHETKTGKVMQICAGIAMTNATAIIRMQGLFGGSLFKGGPRPNPRHKPLHSWTVCSQLAASFLRIVHPFLLIKAEEVAVALEFQESVDKWNHKLGNRWRFSPERDEIFAYRKHLDQRLRQLKLKVIPFDK